MNEKQAFKEEEQVIATNKRCNQWINSLILLVLSLVALLKIFTTINIEQDLVTLPDIQSSSFFTKQEKKPTLVLHTGFPPLETVKGLPILPGKAAAAAFIPKPSTTTNDVKVQTRKGGESWWDRLFPNHHVHLSRVQLPIMSSTNKTMTATLSICPSERSRFGSSRFPDTKKCLSTRLVQLSPIEEGDDFGVIDWEPELVVVLKKSTVYWLVVQAPDVDASFDWVYAKESKDAVEKESIIAVQNENGWQLQLAEQPIPSVMILVEEHS